MSEDMLCTGRDGLPGRTGLVGQKGEKGDTVGKSVLPKTSKCAAFVPHV